MLNIQYRHSCSDLLSVLGVSIPASSWPNHVFGRPRHTLTGNIRFWPFDLHKSHYLRYLIEIPARHILLRWVLWCLINVTFLKEVEMCTHFVEIYSILYQNEIFLGLSDFNLRFSILCATLLVGHVHIICNNNNNSDT